MDLYSACLETVLGHINNEDVKAAGEAFHSDSIYDYYESVAEMLNSLYDFEAFRAEIVESALEATR